MKKLIVFILCFMMFSISVFASEPVFPPVGYYNYYVSIQSGNGNITHIFFNDYVTFSSPVYFDYKDAHVVYLPYGSSSWSYYDYEVYSQNYSYATSGSLFSTNCQDLEDNLVQLSAFTGEFPDPPLQTPIVAGVTELGAMVQTTVGSILLTVCCLLLVILLPNLVKRFFQFLT